MNDVENNDFDFPDPPKKEGKNKKKTLADLKEVVPIELTEEQWQIAKDLWNSRPKNPPSIGELTKAVFGRDDLDGRSKEGVALRKKLYDNNIKPSTSDSRYDELFHLTDEHEEFIRNNLPNMTHLEISRVLFNDPHLSNLDRKSRAVVAYIRKLDPKETMPKHDDDIIHAGDYRPPKKLEQTVARVNRHLNTDYKQDTLTGKQKKDMIALMNYLNTYRFMHQMNTYEKASSRALFESSFVRYCHDKHDLSEEEVDQYIVLCTEVVISANIQGRIEMLSKLLDDRAEGDEKFSMNLVNAISTAQTEYNQCVLRSQKLLDSLKVKRSEKEGKAQNENASILNLVQLWKDEESRLQMIAMAEKRKEKLKSGVKELMEMDELVAKIYGISEDEVLDG